jgi:Tfp pilus assembly protein PilV
LRARADEESVFMRLRGEKGFGMFELLAALSVLNIGILAIVAAFNSGAIALRRASSISTAAALGDKQMELYRAVAYNAIILDTTSVAATDSTYQADSAYSASQVTATCSPVVDSCNPSRSVAGADHVNYRVDSYIVYDTPSGGRQLKKVTIVVRNSSTVKTLARVSSTFDQSTG